MDKIDLDELEKVLKLRAAFDYGTQPIEFLWGYDRTLIESVPELVARVRELERQRDFVLMHRMPSECLSPKDCVYLAGESPDWRCTAKRERRKKCLEKAVARAEGETGKTADVDAEQAAKEAE